MHTRSHTQFTTCRTFAKWLQDPTRPVKLQQALTDYTPPRYVSMHVPCVDLLHRGTFMLKPVSFPWKFRVASLACECYIRITHILHTHILHVCIPALAPSAMHMHYAVVVCIAPHTVDASRALNNRALQAICSRPCHLGWRTLLKCNKTNHACPLGHVSGPHPLCCAI